MSTYEKKLLDELIQKELDGALLDEEFEQLQHILKYNDNAIEYYSKSMILFSFFQGSDSVELFPLNSTENKNNNIDNIQILKALAEDEKIAQAVETDIYIEQSKKELSCIELGVRSHKLGKLGRVYNAILTIAAVIMILFIVYANIFPTQLSEQVATVTDQLHVKWSASSAKLINGQRLLTNQLPYQIEEGIIQIKYDEGVDVTIEGPAKFTILNKGLDIVYGSLYSCISDIGHGFTVDTPNNRFVDLGTEFGVYVDQNATSELHVYTGAVQYYSGIKGQAKTSKTIKANHAVQFDAVSGEKQLIPVDKEKFVRDLDSKSGSVWRGQDINLADMISGGNGLGNGFRSAAIDPSSGQMIPWRLATFRHNTGNYIRVNGSRYIDGVFIPDGGDGPIVVSSQEHKWQCPDTTGSYKFDIISSLRVLNDVSDFPVDIPINRSDQMLIDAMKGEKPYHYAVPEAWDKSDTTQYSSIFMHSNLGITYDLDSIRTVVPDHRISRFESRFGIVEKFMNLESTTITGMHVDVWVLIDGQVRCMVKFIDATRITDINVELDDTDRFLTLVVTDSGDDYAFDWGLFVDPVLKLEK